MVNNLIYYCIWWRKAPAGVKPPPVNNDKNLDRYYTKSKLVYLYEHIKKLLLLYIYTPREVRRVLATSGLANIMLNMYYAI